MEVILQADVVNLIALIVFTIAVCWRMDQIRRYGGGLQALAMTVSIIGFTLAFVAANPSMGKRVDAVTFEGMARVLIWGMLALGVAALIVVFYYVPGESARARRAGIEAVPLTIAAAGLQIAMVYIPREVRDNALSGNSVRYWAFAAFFLIASVYLTYGFSACVASIRQFVPAAAGYLRVSLSLLIVGLSALAVVAVLQIAFIFGAMTRSFVVPSLLTVGNILTVAGMFAFMLGITYPLIHARIRWIRARFTLREQYRDLEPLWTVVTEAVPEVVLPAPDGGELKATPIILFDRRVVEIRDALTQLSPLLPDDFDESSPERQAKLIGVAARRYADEGAPSGEVRDILPTTAATIVGDGEPLREVSLAMSRGPKRWVKS
ncbi:MAB_1171c family putative transporter [Gordonia crocea]|uniref:DUF6545 domain-containing protein n=1 Tax=Gordonia crocea TaxID=589162 RepID=A0A7M3SUE1_9ACTN|nr:MAB_1171c family putative transporter [Gordonia crocea]GED96265.1 hypothetical protein nbrc107697_03040 [Gordonia crocea]